VFLLYAAKYLAEHLRVVEQEVSHQASTTFLLNDMFIACAEQVRKGLDTPHPVDYYISTGTTGIHYTAWHGLNHMMQNLFPVRREDIVAAVNVANSRGMVPLQYAASNGHSTTAKILLDNGAAVNARVISSASIGGNEELLKLLLARDRNVDEHAMISASRYGHEQIVEILLEAASELNTKRDLATEPLP
jgi:hypothetical protein